MYPASLGLLELLVALGHGQLIGDFGPAAFRFADFLASARQGIWQVLPLGPVGYGNSPYSSTSAFARSQCSRYLPSGRPSSSQIR